MKVARFVLKIIAVSMATAAVICCIIAYWDKICDLFGRATRFLREKSAHCPLRASEYDDYADDWD